MLYNNRDLRMLKDEIEFVDTAIVPFVNIGFDGNLLHHANNLELIQLVTIQLEKQLKGRLMITPSLTSVGGDSSSLAAYRDQLTEYGFKNVVSLSFDALETDGVHNIKMNSIPISDMDNEMKISIINDEVKSVIKQIIGVWNQ
ncbi:hypothetical protein GCM10007275_03850 [Jeotgalicoccus coquinae]|uniref:DUF2487 domain-containing protein n=1 Tax=Jeotgalicoccus coquinae TaxID=709509 RepID=A0A6V7R816_9STAP|nr:DUF2487 family protein [Jeotgalicoccus coquinae]MBB6422950.1 hypothetical protein [Jeotgalicoccus coquinae]GGE11890.1 hypothetical protein GCM10007275_03850 [Jeotgalicoccus coquinae]CAD2073589.1 hypothetical protein JEOCOQ751_00731 [Jeotgalicoccus coquinae]